MRAIDQAAFDHTKALAHRRDLVSRNASLRMMGRSDEQTPLPKVPPKPLDYEVFDGEGTFQGFTLALTKDDAIKEFCGILLEDPDSSNELLERLERGELPVGWRVRRWRA